MKYCITEVFELHKFSTRKAFLSLGNKTKTRRIRRVGVVVVVCVCGAGERGKGLGHKLSCQLIGGLFEK